MTEVKERSSLAFWPVWTDSSLVAVDACVGSLPSSEDSAVVENLVEVWEDLRPLVNSFRISANRFRAAVASNFEHDARSAMVNSGRRSRADSPRAVRLGRQRRKALIGDKSSTTAESNLARPAFASDPNSYSHLAVLKGIHDGLAVLEMISTRLRSDDAVRQLDHFIVDTRERIRRASYISQTTNANILFKGKTKAFARTCNITSLAMVLLSLGIGPDDYDPTKRKRLTEIYEYSVGSKACADSDWSRDVAQLPLGDFLQLVVIEIFYSPMIDRGDLTNASRRTLIHNARLQAARVISAREDIFARVAARFGLVQENLAVGSKGRRAIHAPRISSVAKRTRAHLKVADQEATALVARLLSDFVEVLLATPTRDREHQELLDMIARLLADVGFGASPGEHKVGDVVKTKRGPRQPKRVSLLLGEITLLKRGDPPGSDRVEAIVEKLVRSLVARTIKRGTKTPRAQVRKLVETTMPLADVLNLAEKNGLMSPFAAGPTPVDSTKRAAKPASKSPKKRATATNKPARKPSEKPRVRPAFEKLLRVPRLWVHIARLFVYAGSVPVADYSQFVERAKALGYADMESAYGELMSTRMEIEERFVESGGWQEYRSQVMAEVEPALRRGASVAALRYGHYVSIVALDEDRGITTNDPFGGMARFGTVGRGSQVSWKKANQLGMFRTFHAFYPKTTTGRQTSPSR